MLWYIIVVAAPLIGLATYIVTHIAWNWSTSGKRLLLGFLVGFAAGFIAQIGVSLWALRQGQISWIDGAGFLLVNQFTFLALSDGYIHSINILICSLRVRVLHELLVSEDGLREEDLLDRYNARHVVESRIERLTGSDQMRFEQGRYFTKLSSMLLIAKFYQILQLILLGQTSTGRPGVETK